MSVDVFISVGKPSTPQQEKFVDAIEDYLKHSGFSPRSLGRTDFFSQHPLQNVCKLMRQCAGTVIIAFERIYIAKGVERRGNTNENLLSDTKLPTVWNQIEAAMAYVLDHPLLVIAERGLKDEGLLQQYDWYVQWIDLDTHALSTGEFQGVFSDWKKQVEERELMQKRVTQQPNPALEPEKVTLSWVLQHIPVQTLWGLVTVAVSTLAAVATLSYTFATWFQGKG